MDDEEMRSFTVNVRGDQRERAKVWGWHAYYADGVTAIEMKATRAEKAVDLLLLYDFDVLYVFE